MSVEENYLSVIELEGFCGVWVRGIEREVRNASGTEQAGEIFVCFRQGFGNELAMLTQYAGIAHGGLFFNKADPV